MRNSSWKGVAMIRPSRRWQQKITRMEEQFQHQMQQQKLAHDQLIRTKSFEHAVDETTGSRTPSGQTIPSWPPSSPAPWASGPSRKRPIR